MSDQHGCQLIFGGGQRLLFKYTNWRGETSQRRVQAWGVFWGTTPFHTEPQWLLQAFDHEKRVQRVFAMRDMKEVTAE